MPGDSVVKILNASTSGGSGSIPGRGTKISHATGAAKNNNVLFVVGKGLTVYVHASKSDAALAGQINKTREEGGALRKGRGHQGGGGQQSGRSCGGAGEGGAEGASA